MNQNKKPYVIVITGGIATGKSQASNYIRELGYTLLDCDKIVHDGYNQKGDLYHSLINVFGQSILGDNEYIDTQKLGKIVLANDELLKKLNGIVHKYVTDELLYSINTCNDKLIFLDIPLMFEEKENLVKLGLMYNEIWLIYVSEEIQRQRLVKRATLENKNVEQALRIIDKQMPIERKKQMADKVISNQGTIEELKEQIRIMIENLNI